jgi:hypothetical protein
LPMNQGLSVKSFLISSRGNCFVSGSIAQKKTALVKLQTYMEDIRYWKRAQKREVKERRGEGFSESVPQTRDRISTQSLPFQWVSLGRSSCWER